MPQHKQDFHFQTQTALGAGLGGRFPGTGFRNVLPRKGTRTVASIVVVSAVCSEMYYPVRGRELEGDRLILHFAVERLEMYYPERGRKQTTPNV